ncbi:MAG: flagellar hook-length control protein FliK [Lachnospiraceae bacterium]|nr:flagellar hook-length control protein FliK [Lachnospiraceae bacterium]
MKITDNHFAINNTNHTDSVNDPRTNAAQQENQQAKGTQANGQTGSNAQVNGQNVNASQVNASRTGTSQVIGNNAADTALSSEDRQLIKLLSQNYQGGADTYSSTIQKALSDAGLAFNTRNYQIASMLLDNGLSISRESIRNMLTSSSAHPDTPAQVLIDMMKSGIEINSENIRIVQDFNEHSQAVANEINEIADMIESLLSGSDTTPELDTAIRAAIYEAVTAAEESSAANGQAANVNESLANIANADSLESQAAQAGEGGAKLAADSNALANGAGTGRTNPSITQSASGAINLSRISTVNISQSSVPSGAVNAGTISSAATNAAAQNIHSDMTGLIGNPQRIVVETTPASLPQQPSTEEGGGSFSDHPWGNAAGGNQQASQMLDESITQGLQGRISDAESEKLYDAISSANLEAAQEAGEVFASALESDPDRSGLHRMLADEFKAMSPAELKKALKGALSLNPKDINKDSVKELYKRTYEFLDKIKNAADNSTSHMDLGSKSQHAAKELETLYKLNSLYPHFELPVKLESGDGQTGLYVYANKRASQIKADRTSALLHLNMPNLGTVDIHLELNGKNLGMRFYSEDDASALLKVNIGDLNKKLEEMSYSVNTTFNRPEKEKADEAELPVTSSKKNESNPMGPKYNFDIKA